jgi:hypothetical protein
VQGPTLSTRQLLECRVLPGRTLGVPSVRSYR